MILISNVFELEGEQASMRCDIEKKENSIQAQTIVQLFLDVCIILSSMGGALWVRMDFQFGGIDTVFCSPWRNMQASILFVRCWCSADFGCTTVCGGTQV